MSSIGEKTKISISLVIAIISLTMWLAQVHFSGVANANAISEIQSRQNKLDSMQTDIAVIKVTVESMNKRLERMEQ